MNKLPEDIEYIIYEYRHQMGFNNVMDELKCCFAHCGWCGDRQRMWTECDCWHMEQDREHQRKQHIRACIYRGIYYIIYGKNGWSY